MLVYQKYLIFIKNILTCNLCIIWFIQSRLDISDNHLVSITVRIFICVYIMRFWMYVIHGMNKLICLFCLYILVSRNSPKRIIYLQMLYTNLGVLMLFSLNGKMCLIIFWLFLIHKIQGNIWKSKIHYFKCRNWRSRSFFE